jgi:hypothetical protein
MDIKGILDNPLIKTVLLKKLNKAWEEGGLTMITLTRDANGELEVNQYTEPMKVISQKDFTNIIMNEE